MYGSTPRWYQDSFYDIMPPWIGQYRESHTPFENSRSLPAYTSRHRYLPLGPPSDITSTAGPPSTVGPSASESGATTTTKKVDFSTIHDIEETSSTSSQLDVPRKNVNTTQLKDKPFALEGRTSEGVSQQREIFHTDERRQKPDVTSLEIRDMDITTSARDVYYSMYPDFQLPLPNRPRISDLFVGNTRLISNTNSPMSILRIPSLKKMYGTTEFAIDRSTGQLYKIGDMDMTPVNLFAGIPDEDLCEDDVKTTTSLLEKPQAMSTPITDVPRNMLNETIMEDNIPLPTPMIFPPSQEEGRTKSSTTVVEDISPEDPIFILNRVNVQVASSVSSLEEGEGIVNEDEYEKAVHRLEKIHKKITILLQNWNEESKQARNTNEITEIEEFYRPYMDQYNNRRKELERLMRMYSEYCTSEGSPETPQQRQKTKQQMPPSASQIQQTPQETIPVDVFKRREQVNQPLEMEETNLKEGMDIQPTIVVSSTISGVGPIISSLPSTTRPCEFQNTSVDTATEGIGRMRILPQGRMSTLSSMVSPMPTTTTRTIAITREESRQDALETVRQMIGPTSSSTVLPMSTSTAVTQEPCVSNHDNVNMITNEVRPRVSGTHLDSGMTDMTTPIGMATPIAPDLVWPGHPDLQGTNLFPREDDPTTISAGGLDPDERWKIHHPYEDLHQARKDEPDTSARRRMKKEMEWKRKDLKGLEVTISQYDFCLRGAHGDDLSDSEAEGAMATTLVADDAPAVSPTPESLTSPQGEEQTRSMEVDDGDEGQPLASPVSHREDELLTGGDAVGVEGEMANLTVSSPGGGDDGDEGVSI